VRVGTADEPAGFVGIVDRRGHAALAGDAAALLSQPRVLPGVIGRQSGF